MRLLRVDYAESPTTLDLHPLITVVDGLSASQRTELIGHVRRIAAGSTAGLRGLVHHGNELLELDGLGEGLNLVASDLEPVLKLDDQPEEKILGYKRALVSSAQVEEIRAQLTTGLEAQVLDLRRRLREAIEQSEDIPVENGSTLDPPGQSAVVDVDRVMYSQVGEAFVRVQRTPRNVLNRPAEIVELQQRWSRFTSRWAESKQHTDQLEAGLNQASADLASAESALRVAEEAARPVLLSRTQERRLEQLAEKAEAGSRRWRRSNSLSDGEQRELDSLLQVVGVQSWTEYSVFRLAPTIAEDKQLALEQAEQNFAAAEARVESAGRALSEDALVAELAAERNSIRQAAAPYLGALMPEDLEQALLTYGHDDLNPEWAGAVTELCRVLDHAQLEPVLSSTDSDSAQGDFEHTADQILNWTREWLVTQEQAMARIQAVGTGPEEIAQSQPADQTVAAAVDTVADLRSALEQAERRLSGHRRAIDELAGAEARYRHDVLVAADIDGVDGHPAGQAKSISDRLTEISGHPAGDEIGSLPLLVDLDAEGSPGDSVPDLLDKCRELSERFQIIVLARQPEAHVWADLVGSEVAFSVGRNTAAA